MIPSATVDSAPSLFSPKVREFRHSGSPVAPVHAPPVSKGDVPPCPAPLHPPEFEPAHWQSIYIGLFWILRCSREPIHREKESASRISIRAWWDGLSWPSGVVFQSNRYFARQTK